MQTPRNQQKLSLVYKNSVNVTTNISKAESQLKAESNKITKKEDIVTLFASIADPFNTWVYSDIKIVDSNYIRYY